MPSPAQTMPELIAEGLTGAEARKCVLAFLNVADAFGETGDVRRLARDFRDAARLTVALSERGSQQEGANFQ
ncbi:MAG: hypothetical protein RJQ08_13425 [Salinisphaeraceae bacterium]